MHDSISIGDGEFEKQVEYFRFYGGFVKKIDEKKNEKIFIQENYETVKYEFVYDKDGNQVIYTSGEFKGQPVKDIVAGDVITLYENKLNYVSIYIDDPDNSDDLLDKLSMYQDWYTIAPIDGVDCEYYKFKNQYVVIGKGLYKLNDSYAFINNKLHKLYFSMPGSFDENFNYGKYNYSNEYDLYTRFKYDGYNGKLIEHNWYSKGVQLDDISLVGPADFGGYGSPNNATTYFSESVKVTFGHNAKELYLKEKNTTISVGYINVG